MNQKTNHGSQNEYLEVNFQERNEQGETEQRQRLVQFIINQTQKSTKTQHSAAPAKVEKTEPNQRSPEKAVPKLPQQEPVNSETLKEAAEVQNIPQIEEPTSKKAIQKQQSNQKKQKSITPSTKHHPQRDNQVKGIFAMLMDTAIKIAHTEQNKVENEKETPRKKSEPETEVPVNLGQQINGEQPEAKEKTQPKEAIKAKEKHTEKVKLKIKDQDKERTNIKAREKSKQKSRVKDIKQEKSAELAKPESQIQENQSPTQQSQDDKVVKESNTVYPKVSDTSIKQQDIEKSIRQEPQMEIESDQYPSKIVHVERFGTKIILHHSLNQQLIEIETGSDIPGNPQIKMEQINTNIFEIFNSSNRSDNAGEKIVQSYPNSECSDTMIVEQQKFTLYKQNFNKLKSQFDKVKETFKPSILSN